MNQTIKVGLIGACVFSGIDLLIDLWIIFSKLIEGANLTLAHIKLIFPALITWFAIGFIVGVLFNKAVVSRIKKDLKMK